jgi:TPR repeat protein
MKKYVVSLAALMATTVGVSFEARADNPSILLDPPNLDYKVVCKAPDTSSRPKIEKDWTKTPASQIGLAAPDIVTLAMEYNRGSDRVQKAPDVAEALLRAGVLKFPQRRDAFLIPLARVLMDQGSTIDELREAETNLFEAYKSGNGRAAYVLGQLYGDEGPAEMRDVKKSYAYLEKSALSSDPDGVVEYARIITLDPQATDAQKKSAVTNALLGLMAQIKAGDCSALNEIGFLYLRGNLVSKEVDVALKWLEAFAKTGDVRTAQNLSELYRSNQIDQIDIQKSMTYLKQAADGGIASAQFTLGKAYATGVSVPQDLTKAIKYLQSASDTGLHPADEWLARVYSGEFGGKVDSQKAKQYFERAMQSADNAGELPVQYGAFLANFGGGKEDTLKALAILESAAKAGSADASDEIGKIYLQMGRKDTAYLAKAMQFFNESAAAGNSDGAAKLAGMFACGQGAPLSVELANEWRHKAAVFGSVYSLYVTGLNMLTSSEAADKAKGRVYLQQAAFKGSPEAIGYVVARWETGVDGFILNTEAAQRLMTFVASINNADQKKLAELSIISNRFDVATTLDGKSTQIKALDPYISADDKGALLLKAQLLQRAGQATDGALVNIYKTLAETGDVRGMREYGKVLLTDFSVESNVGRDWLKKAADGGDFKAKISLIDPADPNAMQMIAAVTAAGEACTVDSMVNVGRVYATLPDPEAKTLARYWLSLAERLSDQDADDLYAVGAAFRDGVDGVENRYKAEAFFLRANALGRISVLRDLAEGHLQGLWTSASPEAAKDYLLKLYAAGDKDAANKLLSEIADGRITSNVSEVDDLLRSLGGDVVDPGKYLLKIVRLNTGGKLGHRDDAAVLRWLTLSANNGEASAMYRLYQAYFFGSGAEKNPTNAFVWLTKSAEAGNPKAARELSTAYQVGVVGLNADQQKAVYWDTKFKELSGQ